MKSMKVYFEKLYKKTFNEFAYELKKWISLEQKKFIITANPETLMIGLERPDFNEVLTSEEIVILPDGIGVVKAANALGYQVSERIAGIEVVETLLNELNEQAKKIYLFGAHRDVIKQLVCKLESKYPNINIVGYQDGYVEEKDEIFEQIVRCQPDAVLVALGIPQQELLIYKHYAKFKKGIFIGVGGTFDVISGTKKRAPKLFIKLNLEWLYRIVKEPKRFRRFYKSNIKFILKVKEMRYKK